MTSIQDIKKGDVNGVNSLPCNGKTAKETESQQKRKPNILDFFGRNVKKNEPHVRKNNQTNSTPNQIISQKRLSEQNKVL